MSVLVTEPQRGNLKKPPGTNHSKSSWVPNICWLVVLTILKNISQWEELSHILWKISHVWNHQPVWQTPNITIAFHQPVLPLGFHMGPGDLQNLRNWHMGMQYTAQWVGHHMEDGIVRFICIDIRLKAQYFLPCDGRLGKSSMAAGITSLPTGLGETLLSSLGQKSNPQEAMQTPNSPWINGLGLQLYGSFGSLPYSKRPIHLTRLRSSRRPCTVRITFECKSDNSDI